MILILLYLCAAVLANLSVAYFGPVMIPVNSFLLIGLNITTRDGLHERWKGPYLWLKMLLLIGSGSLITYVLNRGAARIAFASFLAFVLAGLADTIIYHFLIKKGRFAKVNGSNAVSALVDSLIFPTIAFGAVMPGIIATQYIMKITGGFIWSLILSRVLWRKQEAKNV